MPNIYVIAGSNGAGKTTFAREFLPQYAHCPNFINADLIAQGLAPFSPSSMGIKAGRLLLEQVKDFVNKRADFAIESTLAGKTYLSLFKELKRKGYSIHIFFLWIPATGLAKARISQRVKNGGHDVPPEDVIRRFGRSRENFLRFYKPLCDVWTVFDNSMDKPEVVAYMKEGRTTVIDEALYEKILGGSNG